MKTMKQAFLATACAAAVTLGANSAQAADLDETVANMNWYVSAFGGVSLWNKYDPTWSGYTYNMKFKTGFIAGAAIGVDGILMENLRHEVEVSYMETKLKSLASTAPFIGIGPSGKTSSVNVLFNTWYDIDFGGPIKPYLGGGLGVGFMKSRAAVTNGAGLQWSGSDTGFAFQLGAGAKYEVTENIALDVSYRFRGVLDVNFTPAAAFPGGFSKDDFLVHTVQAGVSFKF